MVHGGPLRGTGASTPLTWGRRHIVYPLVGIHPCYSGLQVTGHRWLPDWCSLAKGRGSILLQKLILINIDFYSLQIRKMCYNVQALGPVAQLGERSVRIREVESSSLFRSTKWRESLKNEDFLAFFVRPCISCACIFLKRVKWKRLGVEFVKAELEVYLHPVVPADIHGVDELG